MTKNRNTFAGTALAVGVGFAGGLGAQALTANAGIVMDHAVKVRPELSEGAEKAIKAFVDKQICPEVDAQFGKRVCSSDGRRWLVVLSHQPGGPVRADAEILMAVEAEPAE